MMKCIYCRKDGADPCDGCSAPVCEEHREPGMCVMCKVQPHIDEEEAEAAYAEYVRLRARAVVEWPLDPVSHYDGYHDAKPGGTSRAALDLCALNVMRIGSCDMVSPHGIETDITHDQMRELTHAGVGVPSHDPYVIAALYPLSAKVGRPKR